MGLVCLHVYLWLDLSDCLSVCGPRNSQSCSVSTVSAIPATTTISTVSAIPATTTISTKYVATGHTLARLERNSRRETGCHTKYCLMIHSGKARKQGLDWL